jgi:hypothetical protein
LGASAASAASASANAALLPGRACSRRRRSITSKVIATAKNAVDQGYDAVLAQVGLAVGGNTVRGNLAGCVARVAAGRLFSP